MSETRAEQETHFRWDNEGRTLEAWTADPRVADRWRRAKFPVRVLGTTHKGSERAWEVILPWSGARRPWTRLFQRALPGFGAMREDDEKGISSSAGPPEPRPGDDDPQI